MKPRSDLKAVTQEMLAGFKNGQVIDEYCFFKNVVFEEIEGNNVVLSDKFGNKKKDPIWLFLKHAKIK